MITALILSKNRPQQLHLLLESIECCAPKLFDKIDVIWNASNKDYACGYAKVCENSPFNTHHIYDNNRFMKTFTDYINNSQSHLICGLTDDCVFFHKLSESASSTIHSIFDFNDVFTFTLRMGLNTTVQWYVDKSPQPQLNQYYELEDVAIAWNWKEQSRFCNYGYPWTMDAHIYRQQDLARLTNWASPKSLREWEGKIVSQGLDNEAPLMTSFRASSVLSLANNCVQDPPMRAGVFYYNDPATLNSLYLNDKVIDYQDVVKKLGNVTSCHNEIEFNFKARS